MPGWVLAAGLGSIALTALLTLVLWRGNAPANGRAARRDSGDGAVLPIVADGGADDREGGDAASDGGDGGADGGGGGGGGE